MTLQAGRLLATGMVAVVASLLCNCTSQSLEHGYCHVQWMMPTLGGFEGIAHYNDLYDGLRRLGTVGQYSISPSGRFALFEEDGQLRLYQRHHWRIRDVTDGEFEIPQSFTWLEDQRVVEVDYYEHHAQSRIALPK